MILVDTSVWVDHLRRSDAVLVSLLDEGMVMTHPMIIGELACGNLPGRDDTLAMLGLLPPAPVASNEEALAFIEGQRLMGRGIGYIDVHLLASTRLSEGTRIWTMDARLKSAASRLFVSWHPDE